MGLKRDKCIEIGINCPPKMDGGIKAQYDNNQRNSEDAEEKVEKWQYKGAVRFKAIDEDGDTTETIITGVDKELADIEYYIYQNGNIEYKINNKEKREKAQYYYYDSSNNIHDLGVIKLKKISQSRITKPKQLPKRSFYNNPIGGEYIYLVDVRDINSSYNNGDIKYKLSLNTTRYFINDITTAAFLGAMLNCGYEDFVFNGASDETGYSAGPSNSHWNGMHLDFRYLRKDKSGKNLHLNLSSETGDPCGWKGLDEVRQNKFNDELYLFGWTSMLSYYYNNKKLLNHTINYANHNHHLHVQIFKPKLKNITK
ncbi:hypothetical protein ETU08_11735 [Apibacter muscae]|uniref:hypothetical protein n=1 Tax=Apibacter muscae TaxID=2509004 RepID=UPI0011AC1A54|nr:hypothetical protein [Apibacter muscae]TWP27667.1 hypothetical protein ETU08_11735 [Apibacter muscae]